MVEVNEDDELTAIRTVLSVLTPLKAEARSNVIDYVFRRLGITSSAVAAAAQPLAPSPASPVTPSGSSFQATSSGPPLDLRSLTDQKQPKSDNQMVAVLAYYLAHLAPTEQRRDLIVPEDIKKYFPQANFELPTGRHSMTLVNAKNAGYLDAVSAGQYRLNPVGHNLVTHKLPRGDHSAPSRGARRVGKKAAKKKKS